MRVRLSGPGAVPLCGNTTRGEVEDYTLQITSVGANGIFAGGNGRGDIAMTAHDIPPLPVNIFSGGNGRGDVAVLFDPHAVLLALKVVLDGPYSSSTGLMSDNLRTMQVIPLVEPYTALGYVHTSGGGGESVTPAVMGLSGSDAIVDWVLVELRSAADPSVVLASRSALLQRDGDVVGTNGVSPVNFTLAPGTYHVAVRHRNHLGVMTAVPVSVGGAIAPLVDFTLPATPTYGSNARRNNGAVMTLWAGNADGNTVVNYSGSNNDRTSILTLLGAASYLTSLPGYHRQDVNLNGSVNYSGSANDRTAVLNSLGAGTFLTPLIEQLP
jgi:hypothetical protein